jgi:hypothetical protein
MLFTAQDQLGRARKALTDLRAKNPDLYKQAEYIGDNKAIVDLRNKAKAEIAKIESEHRAQIEEAENTLKALRSQGDIVVPGGEKKSDRKVINLDKV